MKYSFNEKELLDLFVTNDDSLPLFMHPYLKDGYVCATDNNKIIRIKADALNGEYEPTDRMNLEWPNESCDYIITDKDLEKALASIPQVEEEIEIGEDVKCPECDGTGTVYWEYDDRNFKSYRREFDCPVCDGSGYVEEAQVKKTGKMIPDPTAAVGIANGTLRIGNIQTLLEAMKIIGTAEIHLVAQVDYKNLFKVDDNISILIAHYFKDQADYIIKPKEE